jgi:hypothetical protein
MVRFETAFRTGSIASRAFRWIVTDAAWRAAQEALGATLRIEARLETHSAGEP